MSSPIDKPSFNYSTSQQQLNTDHEDYRKYEVDPDKSKIYVRSIKIGDKTYKVGLIVPKETTISKINKIFEKDLDSIGDAIMATAVRKSGEQKNYGCVMWLGKDGSIQLDRKKNGKTKTKKYDRNAVALKIKARMKHFNPLTAKPENL